MEWSLVFRTGDKRIGYHTTERGKNVLGRDNALSLMHRLMEVFILESDKMGFVLQPDNASSSRHNELECRKDWAACKI